MKTENPRIEHFVFEIYPLSSIGAHGGEEKMLRMSVRVNGETVQHQTMFSGSVFPPPWQSEISFFAERAARTLEKMLEDHLKSEAT